MSITERFDRKELKFVIDDAARRRVTASLRGRTLPDPHGDAEGRYPLQSLYYDNAARELYWERERGITSRRKLRVRLYGGVHTAAPPASFVEIKHKYASRVAKRRLQLPIESALALCGREEPAYIDVEQTDRLVREVRRLVTRRELEPALIIRYTRQAFRGDARWPDLRVTFDDELWCRADRFHLKPDDEDFDLPLLAPSWSVLEIKVAQAVPRWLSEVIAKDGLTVQRHSKYARAVSMRDPHLAPQPCWPVPAQAPMLNGRANDPASSHIKPTVSSAEEDPWTT